MLLDKILNDYEIHVKGKISVLLDDILFKLSKTEFNIVSILESEKNKAAIYVYENENLISTIYSN